MDGCQAAVLHPDRGGEVLKNATGSAMPKLGKTSVMVKTADKERCLPTSI